jgi:hypothetical protein
MKIIVHTWRNCRDGLPLKRGDTQSAISDYRRAIDLFTVRYEDNLALTGSKDDPVRFF